MHNAKHSLPVVCARNAASAKTDASRHLPAATAVTLAIYPGFLYRAHIRNATAVYLAVRQNHDIHFGNKRRKLHRNTSFIDYVAEIGFE